MFGHEAYAFNDIIWDVCVMYIKYLFITDYKQISTQNKLVRREE